MSDQNKDERIIFLIKALFYLKDGGYIWPELRTFIERKIQEELDKK